MFDKDIKDKVVDFIQSEAMRIKHGKLVIELTVYESIVTDAECTPKPKIRFIPQKK